jgi:hypothetical protein
MDVEQVASRPTGAPATDEAAPPGPPLVERIRFVPEAPTAPPAGDDATLTVVLDTTWTPAGGGRSPRLLGLRDVVEGVMERRDLIAEAARALDGWAEATGIVQILAIEGVSFWYEARLRYWMWLLDHLLWLSVVDDLVTGHPDVRELACAAGADAPLVAAAGWIATRDGIAFAADDPGANGAVAGSAAPPASAARSTAATPARTGVAMPRRPRSLLGRLRWRLRPPAAERRRRAMVRRLRAIEGDPRRRLLVVQAHARQRVDTPSGTRWINPYLGPVVDRLRGTRLEPFEVDIRARLADAAAWPQLDEGTLPVDVLDALGAEPRSDAGREAATRAGAAVRSLAEPLVVRGVDLGPPLAAVVAARTEAILARRIDGVRRIAALLRRVHPAGILLADEYHRQDWLAAAGAAGVPVAAVQHGVIYRWHTGYVHASRPEQLRLPDRTYVYGTWERDLLTTVSAYRSDEVVVGGSPRLALVEAAAVDAAGLRRELGVAPGDRMVVLSGTWGPMYRRFHYPIALAHLFDRPLERVHLVVKLHPSEKDEGPYRRIVENLAAAGGFAPPPVTIVQAVDLYRLLAAADAHLGIHSTLLTEAVATGTPNLLAVGLASADLLGYVDAGVAVPVRDAADLLAVLERPRDEVTSEADRAAFLRAHFEPGDAARRVADDLLAWLP